MSTSVSSPRWDNRGHPGEYCGNPSPGTGPHWLLESGAWEKEGEHPDSHWPFHPVCANICNPVPHHPSNCQSGCWTASSFTWSAREDFDWLEEEFWKWANLPIYACSPAHKKLRTSLYHPQTNDQCKKFSSTLIKMLGTLPPECKSNWKGSVGPLVHAYICTCNWALDFRPYFLMYGRQPWLLINVTFGMTLNSTPAPTFCIYAQIMRGSIKWAYKKADLYQQSEAQCHKQNYDQCSKAVSLRPAVMVLIHVTTFNCRHNIQSQWENMWYIP